MKRSEITGAISLSAFVALALLASSCTREAPDAPKIGAAVRIQARELGPGWHRGFFNQLRTPTPCYLVVLFSADGTRKLVASIPVSRMGRLQVSSAPGSTMEEWDGLALLDVPDASWRQVDLAGLLPEQGACNYGDPPK